MTGSLTYAAEQKLATAPAPAAGRAVRQAQAVVTVPDVTKQAFVFAKGALQDAGFAWKVSGGVRGYSSNVVVSQSPAAGTKVYDTGAPAVTVTLQQNGKYAQIGEPQDASPYRATTLRLVEATLAPPVPTANPGAAAPKPAVATPAATPAAKSAAKSAAKPAAKPAAHPYPQDRPVAFAVAGAPKEPLAEMPLPDRARVLGKWIAGKPRPTDANVRRWLYQNAWIVSGARFGWWRGAQALRILIDVDRRTESIWGIGTRSRGAAEAALRDVEAKAK